MTALLTIFAHAEINSMYEYQKVKSCKGSEYSKRPIARQRAVLWPTGTKAIQFCYYRTMLLSGFKTFGQMI